MKCSVADCGRPYAAKGFCHKHYNRWRRHGDPTHTEFFMPRTETWARVGNADQGAIIITDGQVA